MSSDGSWADQLVEALTRGGADRPESRVLDPMVGTWATLTEWEPIVGRGVRRSEGTMEAGWIVGGRALEMRTIDPELGETARVLLAFDVSSEDYVAFSVTLFSSFFGIDRGHYDPSTRTLALDGTEPAPALEKIIDYRRTFRFLDEDTFTVDISYPGVPVGTYGPMLVTYRRDG